MAAPVLSHCFPHCLRRALLCSGVIIVVHKCSLQALGCAECAADAVLGTAQQHCAVFQVFICRRGVFDFCTVCICVDATASRWTGRLLTG
jgi:hypothetical protein